MKQTLYEFIHVKDLANNLIISIINHPKIFNKVHNIYLKKA